MKRKEIIVESATSLFASQGFEATTTLQIAQASRITEPLIYYHFGGKDELFTHILSTAFSLYFERFDALPKNSSTELERISNLFKMHFQIAEDSPELMRLIVSTCPTKLHDPESECIKNYKKARQALFDYFSECLERGIETKEFRELTVSETAHVLVALTNGLLRQKIFKLSDVDGIKDATIEFCRYSLLSNKSRINLFDI